MTPLFAQIQGHIIDITKITRIAVGETMTVHFIGGRALKLNQDQSYQLTRAIEELNRSRLAMIHIASAAAQAGAA